MTQQPNAMSLDDFLGHKTSEGGGGAFLRWNKRQPPTVDVWLHTRAPFTAVWQHGFPRIVTRKDDVNDPLSLVHEEVWGSSWNCWEGEAVLKRQYFRDRQTGARKTPPVICSMCKLIEAIRMLVDVGKLKWTDPVFAFEVGHESDRTLHAGGLYNAFARQDLTREELEELKEKRIYRTEAWRENAMSKCSYIFRVVDNDHVDEGVMISVEGSGLGDKVKAAIRDKRTSAGQEAGNPILNPYAIRWEYHPNERSFNERYRAIVMNNIPLTPEINRLITEVDPPDISKLTKPGNPKLLRAVMEDHWCGPNVIDWDEIFGDVETAFAKSGDDPTDFLFGKNEPEKSRGTDRRPAERAERPVETRPDETQTKSRDDGAARAAEQQSAEQPNESADVEIVACDKCGADMLITDPVCKKCGEVYEEVEAKPASQPPRRSRRAANEAKQQVEQTKSRMQSSSATARRESNSWNSSDDIDPFDGDDLPF